jgi:hypothetical protein
VRVSIVDRDAAGGVSRQSFLVRLDGDAPARVELHGKARSVELGVRRNDHAGTLAFAIERRDHLPSGPNRALEVRADVRLRPGASATIAQLEHPEGSSTEVRVEAR